MRLLVVSGCVSPIAKRCSLEAPGVPWPGTAAQGASLVRCCCLDEFLNEENDRPYKAIWTPGPAVQVRPAACRDGTGRLQPIAGKAELQQPQCMSVAAALILLAEAAAACAPPGEARLRAGAVIIRPVGDAEPPPFLHLGPAAPMSSEPRIEAVAATESKTDKKYEAPREQCEVPPIHQV